MIGSGASGLAAAFRLQQGGHAVRVLERADRIGSTLRSRREHDYLLDQGAFFLTSAHTRMLRIVEEVGLLDQVVPGKLIPGTLRDGKVHELNGDHFGRDLSRPRLFSLRSNLRPLRLRDGDSVERWAARRLVALRDGMGSYPERLAERFEIELRAEALEVVETPNGVTLTWRDADAVERVEPADGVVLAVPAAAASQLMPGLDEWRAGFIGEVREGQLITANVASSRAPRGLGATYVQIPRGAHPFLGGIVLDHNKAPGRTPPGAGLLTLIALGDWSRAHRDDDDAEVGRELLNALESVLPGTLHDVRFVEINRWSQQLHPIEHDRKFGRFRELCGSHDRRVQLAGDFQAPQSLESATAAGETAARRLVAALAHRREAAGARARAMRRAAGRRA